jgi:hypothetical protein
MPPEPSAALASWKPAAPALDAAYDGDQEEEIDLRSPFVAQRQTGRVWLVRLQPLPLALTSPCRLVAGPTVRSEARTQSTLAAAGTAVHQPEGQQLGAAVTRPMAAPRGGPARKQAKGASAGDESALELGASLWTGKPFWADVGERGQGGGRT